MVAKAGGQILQFNNRDKNFTPKNGHSKQIERIIIIFSNEVRMLAVNEAFTQKPAEEELMNLLHRNFPGAILRAGGHNSSEILFNFASPALVRVAVKPADSQSRHPF